MLDALGLDGGRIRFARQINRIESALPMRLTIPIELLLLKSGIDVDPHEFGAEARIERWRLDQVTSDGGQANLKEIC